MFGLLNVSKPPGCTSRDVVNRVQRVLKPVKVGHAGTLDPLATGVLVLGIGPATRLVPYIQKMRKRYAATFLLGLRSPTDDVEGEVQPYVTEVKPTEEQIAAAIPAFVGEIMQRPPEYSALKVRGQRAYELARRGDAVKLAPRPVSVYSITLRSYVYPELKLDMECGSGTYIRAIGRDLAAAMNTGAVMSELTRTAIGCFRIEQAIDAERITKESIEQFLLPPIKGLQDYPVIRVTPEQTRRLANGQFLRIGDHGISRAAAAIDPGNQLIAVLIPHGQHELRPEIVFRT